MATIREVRWYLGNDERTHGWPWQDFIQRACRSHLSAFVIAVVVRSFWDCGKSNCDDDPTVAVIKHAETMSARSAPAIVSTQVKGEDAGPEPNFQGQAEEMAPTHADPGLGAPPVAQGMGERIRERAAARDRVAEAQMTIQAELWDLWEGVRKHSGISESSMHTDDREQLAMVAELFGAFVKHPEMSDADIEKIVNSAVPTAKPQAAWEPNR